MSASAITGSSGEHAESHRSFTSDDANLMQAVANVLGSAVERARVEERLEQEVDNERRRIARDLHDAVLGELTAAIARATVARSTSADSKDEARWAELITVLQRVAKELRSAIYNLRLTSFEDRGFADLLTDLVAIRGDMAVDCQVQLHGRESLPTGSLGLRGIELISIVGEAITNACRHSGATNVRVDARRPSRDVMRLEISDDGDGSDRDPEGSHQPGTGITGMFERAQLLGATLLIEGRAGRGTVVSLELGVAVDEA